MPLTLTESATPAKNVNWPRDSCAAKCSYSRATAH